MSRETELAQCFATLAPHLACASARGDPGKIAGTPPLHPEVRNVVPFCLDTLSGLGFHYDEERLLEFDGSDNGRHSE
jgi:hypothetical protein